MALRSRKTRSSSPPRAVSPEAKVRSGGRNGSLDYLLEATERSMKALGVDKIDLLAAP